MSRALICLFALMVAMTALPVQAEVRVEPTVICATNGSRHCAPMVEPRPAGEAKDITLTRSVFVVGAPGPLAVRLVAMGSSQVRWNGVVIGESGVVGDSAADEQPGRFRTVVAVPPELVRQGENTLTARVTSHHLWLAVRQPVHEFSVGAPADLAATEVRDYVPALAVAGLLFFAALGFGLVPLIDPSQRGAVLLAGIAAIATLQLAIESARAFVPYPYPWQLARIAVIAFLAAMTAVLMARYAAWRFVPARTGLATVATAIIVGAVLLFSPGFDAKALGCLIVGIAAVAILAAAGLRTRPASAWMTLTTAAGAGVLAFAQGAGFLDSGYYLALAAVFAALMVEQVRLLRRPAEAPETATASQLERTDVVRISDGRRVHLLRSDDIAWLKAADDYCEVGLTDGRTLLNGATLLATLAAGRGRFVRVHRSYAVNPRHITGAEVRPGGGRLIMLGAAGHVPVGRVYRLDADRLLGEGTAEEGISSV